VNAPEAPLTYRRVLPPLGAALAACLLVGWLVYRAFLGSYLDGERHVAVQRLDTLALSLEATLSRHESLPGLMALDKSLASLLARPGDAALAAAANTYLEAAQRGAAVAAAYLIDSEGVTLASSNWRLPRSFIGQNYGFRPYFREAMTGGLGRFYGIGATTGEPGYFLAAPVREGGRILGVMAVKVGLGAMEQALAGSGDPLLLVDRNGVVFLASAPSWRYRTLAQLDAATRARLADARQYEGVSLQPLANIPLRMDMDGLRRFSIAGESPRERLVLARPVGGLGWHLVHFLDPADANRGARGAGLAAGFALAFVLGVAVHFRHRARRREEMRRIYAELEGRIAERTADLTEQIAALERTKAILRETRDSAVQAGKLAALGQMSAGISHELNQPLAALQTLADNAGALLAGGRLAEAAENLQMISDLVDRTGRIVRQLKTFARQEAPTPSPVSIASAIEHALMMVEPRRREMAARIEIRPFDRSLQLIAEAGRLEQVLVNLLRNGLDAMAEQDQPLLEVDARRDGATVLVEIRDHGPGLAEEVRRHLFQPFYTTKPAGEGLGLGLAISLTIVESYGGTLSVQNAPDGGAIFALRLPVAGDSND
jgi:two-component system C4-dicarboxylate transport sensor histidine kinase DctB